MIPYLHFPIMYDLNKCIPLIDEFSSNNLKISCDMCYQLKHLGKSTICIECLTTPQILITFRKF